MLPYCNPFPLVRKKRNRASGFFNKGAVKSPDNKAKLKSIFTEVFFNPVFWLPFLRCDADLPSFPSGFSFPVELIFSLDVVFVVFSVGGAVVVEEGTT